ncbi:hypothetical protein M0R45_036390 [Rubus argutus]|uniref:Uncharacterized protein n=1 Tax=Rubus argutus TaxID=59490 RepID=A0AAW1VYP2_RUBAR
MKAQIHEGRPKSTKHEERSKPIKLGDFQTLLCRSVHFGGSYLLSQPLDPAGFQDFKEERSVYTNTTSHLPTPSSPSPPQVHGFELLASKDSRVRRLRVRHAIHLV